MRRARFAVSGSEGINDKASVGDALTFDLRTPETTDDENLVAQRVSMFELAPAFLGATHVVWGLACLLLHPLSTGNSLATHPLVPVILAIILDAAAFLAMRNRDRMK